jgi:hypothetical protein
MAFSPWAHVRFLSGRRAYTPLVAAMLRRRRGERKPAHKRDPFRCGTGRLQIANVGRFASDWTRTQPKADV